ncbi:EamA/RhaT family transporter [Arcobacter venerupis]|uniref:EamA/RhaT family transporter n=1 Tax=Arcobacter venerupis TaxID=1054033 RepID=A0AAE7BCI4_9BACT|nr:DMT family transporter [Arcobacter venerupis]QKF67879.1 EamA/RhaT family transporter [Arcobacter venerupis]RWS49483.1 EamA family transporter [Arcobacter venerupis]
MSEKNKNIFYAFMFLAMAGWGLSWVSAKVLSAYINEYEMIFFRNIFTVITLLPVLLFTKKSFYINLKSFILVLVASVVMIAYMKCFFLGTKFGTASLGGALVTTMIPINTFIIMALFFGKKIEKKDIFALILGALGVFTMLNIWSFSHEEIFSQKNIYFVLASILWPILTIVSSKATKISPMVFTFYMYVITTIMVMVFFVDVPNINYKEFDWIFWLNVLSISIISTTFATTLYFVGIEKLGTNEVSSFIFLVPLFAIILSVIFLKENISLSIIGGTILTLIAVKILNNIKIFKK